MKQCVEADLLFLINFLYWNPNPQHLRMWHGIGSNLWLLPKGEKKSKTCSIHFPWGFWGHRRDLHHNIKWIYQVEFIHFLLKSPPYPPYLRRLFLTSFIISTCPVSGHHPGFSVLLFFPFLLSPSSPEDQLYPSFSTLAPRSSGFHHLPLTAYWGILPNS